MSIQDTTLFQSTASGVTTGVMYNPAEDPLPVIISILVPFIVRGLTLLGNTIIGYFSKKKGPFLILLFSLMLSTQQAQASEKQVQTLQYKIYNLENCIVTGKQIS